MTPPTDRRTVLTRSRIVALALIGLAVLGLTYLRFTGPDRLAVPKGAHAGDLILERCTYATENGGYPADCGTLVVPENRADAQSRLIALPVTRIHARTSRPAEPIFRLEGGPGITNMQFKNASRFADRHDVVLVGYRGMDGSVRLDCPEVESAMKHSDDLLADTSFRARADAFRACADRLTDDGVDLAGYSLPQRVDDLEAARRALGYGRIDLLSESAGTRTAMIYSWRYPRSIHRSVMIGVNPPGHFLWDAKTTGRADPPLRGALCARTSPAAAGPGSRGLAPLGLRAHPEALVVPADQGGERPGRRVLRPDGRDDRRRRPARGAVDDRHAARPPTRRRRRSVVPLADGAGGLPERTALGGCRRRRQDRRGPRPPVLRERANRGSVIGTPGTDLIWAGGRLLDAWPANPDENKYSQVRDSDVETLLIGGELDFATPPQWATRELLPHLPNGQEVVLENLGHTNDFWTYQPEAGKRLINTYFDSGRVDTSALHADVRSTSRPRSATARSRRSSSE